MLEIKFDESVPHGSALLLGPYKVVRQDYGLQVVAGDGGDRSRVYQEKVMVRANGKNYTAWVEVPEDSVARVGDVAATRATALFKALEALGKEIVQDAGKKGDA